MFPNHLREAVNIRCERTDQPYSRNVIDISHHILNGSLVPVPLQLLDNTFRCLDSGLNMFDRIVAVNMLEFVIQYFQLRSNFLQCGIIKKHDGLPTVHIVIILKCCLHVVLSFTSYTSFCYNACGFPLFSYNPEIQNTL